MRCLVKQVDIAASATVGTTISVTDAAINVQPVLVLFVAGGRAGTIDAVGSASHRRMFGAATSPTNRYVWSSASIDGGASSDAGFGGRDECCIHEKNAGGAVGRADLDTMLSNGFRLIIDVQFNADIRVTALVFYGVDAAAVIVPGIEPGAGLGTMNITSSGFGTPDAAIFVGGVRTTAWSAPSSSLVDGSALSIGVVDSAGNQGVLWNHARDNVATMETYGYLYDGELYARSAFSAAISGRAEFSAWITDGIRINWLESNANDARFFTILLKGGKFAVRDWLTRTDTNNIDVDVGFAAHGGIVLSHCRALSTQDTAQANDKWSVGFWDAWLHQGAHGVVDESGTADAEVATAIEQDECYVHVSVSDAVEATMRVIGTLGPIVRFQMSDPDPSAAACVGLFVGEENVGQKYLHYSRMRV